jgi:hypothetical protein
LHSLWAGLYLWLRLRLDLWLRLRLDLWLRLRLGFDDDQGRTHRHALTLVHLERAHLPRCGRRDLDDRLLRFDRHQRVALSHPLS